MEPKKIAIGLALLATAVFTVATITGCEVNKKPVPQMTPEQRGGPSDPSGK